MTVLLGTASVYTHADLRVKWQHDVAASFTLMVFAGIQNAWRGGKKWQFYQRLVPFLVINFFFNEAAEQSPVVSQMGNPLFANDFV